MNHENEGTRLARIYSRSRARLFARGLQWAATWLDRPQADVPGCLPATHGTQIPSEGRVIRIIGARIDCGCGADPRAQRMGSADGLYRGVQLSHRPLLHESVPPRQIGMLMA